MQPGELVLLQVFLDNGLVGLAEVGGFRKVGSEFNRQSGSTTQSLLTIIQDVLAPALIGADPFDIEAAMLRMDNALSGHLRVKAALEIALYDLQGKIVNQPLYRLLGGLSRAGVRLAHMIGIMEEQEALKEARDAFDEGCTAFQIKGTGDIDRDVGVVSRVRKELGDAVVLWLDANQGYRSIGIKETIRAAQALISAGVDYLEQPTDRLTAMAEIRANVSVTVIADESVWSLPDLLAVHEARAADAFSIYVHRAGGLSNARKMAHLGELLGYPYNLNTTFVSGITSAALVHLGVALPGLSLPSPIAVTGPAGGASTRVAGRYFTDDLVTAGVTFEDGTLLPPTGPGLGVEIDEEKLAAYRMVGTKPTRSEETSLAR